MDLNPTSSPTTSSTPREVSDRTLFDFKDADFLDIFMFSTIVLSMIVSPMILIFLIKKRFCKKEVIYIDVKNDEVMRLSTDCIGKDRKLSIEEQLNSDEMESSFVGRSAASSMDRGYRADYIECAHIKQQYRLGSI